MLLKAGPTLPFVPTSNVPSSGGLRISYFGRIFPCQDLLMAITRAGMKYSYQNDTIDPTDGTSLSKKK